MSMIMFVPLLGDTSGPALGSLMSEIMGWRRVIWASVAVATASDPILFTHFRETYNASILKKTISKIAKRHPKP